MPFSPSKSASFFYWSFDMTITQEELKKILHYDHDTGEFIYIYRTSNRVKVGGTAGTKVKPKKKTYLAVTIKCKSYYLHRLAWLYIYGSFPANEIDHINGNGSDNRIVNLREVDSTNNNRNMKLFCTNNSGIVGVSWHKALYKWSSQITINYKKIHLGYFKNISDAAIARKEAEVKYGFHKNHGSDRPL